MKKINDVSSHSSQVLYLFYCTLEMICQFMITMSNLLACMNRSQAVTQIRCKPKYSGSLRQITGDSPQVTMTKAGLCFLCVEISRVSTD